MKHALVVRHVSFEGIAGFAAPIAAAGHAIDHVDVGDEGFANVDFLSPDLLVMMGGPMAVYERAENPWIEDELALLAERIAAGLPTLGVCLGGQLIAAALGAEVARGPIHEVGFAPVELTEAGKASPLAAIDGVSVLHWHGDRFALPEGATLLAKTEAAAQAFAIGNTLALQCHPEMGDPGDGIELWCEGAEKYVAVAGTTIDAIRDQHRRFGVSAADAGRRMIAAWLAGLPVERL